MARERLCLRDRNRPILLESWDAPCGSSQILAGGYRLLGLQLKLPEVIGGVAYATEENSEPVSVRFFGEIFFGDQSVPFQPFSWSQLLKEGGQPGVQIFPVLAKLG